MCDKIKYWHSRGWWTDAMVARAVANGLLSAEQYREITGKEYKEADNG